MSSDLLKIVGIFFHFYCPKKVNNSNTPSIRFRLIRHRECVDNATRRVVTALRAMNDHDDFYAAA